MEGKEMQENIEEVVEFDEELYQKNIKENTFVEVDENDGIGVDRDADN